MIRSGRVVHRSGMNEPGSTQNLSDCPKAKFGKKILTLPGIYTPSTMMPSGGVVLGALEPPGGAILRVSVMTASRYSTFAKSCSTNWPGTVLPKAAASSSRSFCIAWGVLTKFAMVLVSAEYRVGLETSQFRYRGNGQEKR